MRLPGPVRKIARSAPRRVLGLVAMRGALVVSLVATLGSAARADDVATLQRVADAIMQQDVAAFAQLAPGRIWLGRLWFESASCRRQFPGLAMLSPSEQSSFLACLATLEPSVVAAAPGGGRARLVYEPGGELVIGRRLGLGAIEAISVAVTDAHDPAAVPVTHDALAGHRGGAGVVEPEPAVRDDLARAPDAVAFVELTACVDALGKVDAITVTRSSPAHKSYSAAVVAAVKAWVFTPFRLHGKPVRVCGPQLIAYPPERRALAVATAGPPAASAVPPAALAPAAPVVATTVLEKARISGERNIVPDDNTKLAIARVKGPGTAKLTGIFKLCVDEQGSVASVTQLRSTEFPIYDEALEAAMRAWRYRPVVIQGKPAKVCSAVTFIYAQVNPETPPPPRTTK
jgi:hypothetical protein